MNKTNYDALMSEELRSLQGEKKLLLHSCCAPCSSYCVSELRDKTKLDVFYYNPNIDTEAEYQKRLAEEIRFIKEFAPEIRVFEVGYDKDEYLRRVIGKENCPEGGARCEICFRLRLERTAEFAKNHGYDCFATTLTVSPLKNAEKINRIGEEVAYRTGVKYIHTDFKKREGYKKSIELSKKYDLYRQNYCGCEFSKT